MKKNFMAAAMCIILLVSAVYVPAFAAGAFNGSTYSINYITSEVTVSAVADLPNTRVSLVVLNPDKALEAVASDSAALQYQRELTTGADGAFSHTFKLKLAEEPSEGLNFEVYAKVPGSPAENIVDVYYASAGDMTDILSKLSGSTADIKTALTDNIFKSRLGLSAFAPLAKVDIDKLAANMQGNFSGFAATKQGYNDACAYVREFVILELFNENLSSEVFDDDGDYLMESALSFADYDKANGATLWSCYNEQISESAKAQIREELFAQSVETPEALYKLFAEKTVLIGLTNPKTTGYAHVEKLLTSANCDVIDLSYTGTITGDTEAKLAAHSGFDTVTQLKYFIDDAIAEAGEPDDDDDRDPVRRGGSTGGSIRVQEDKTQEPAIAPEVTIFNDVTESHWAAEAIAYLKARSVVSGNEYNYFMPDSPVTREQVVKMLFAIADTEIPTEYELKFADADPDSWYAPYIAAAVSSGIVKGISDTEFGVGMYATRQDICTMINRILGINKSGIKEFVDADNIADYALDSVESLSAEGIVNGYTDGSFKPMANCTRSEVAAMIYRAVKYLEVK